MPSATETLRTKWIADGATTLTDAAAKLRAFADKVDQLIADGYRLNGPVDNGYAEITKTGVPPLPAEITVNASSEPDVASTSWEEIWRAGEEPVVALKWLMESADSLEEIAAQTRAQADEFDRYHQAGWQIYEVSDGYVVAFHPRLAGGPVDDEE